MAREMRLQNFLTLSMLETSGRNRKEVPFMSVQSSEKIRFLSGSDRRERTVRSVLKGQSVLFYHYRSRLREPPSCRGGECTQPLNQPFVEPCRMAGAAPGLASSSVRPIGEEKKGQGRKEGRVYYRQDSCVRFHPTG